MSNDLSLTDIVPDMQKGVTVQSYARQPMIEGVQIAEVKNMSGQDGTFEDLFRINQQGMLELFPDFAVRQINRSTLLPGSIKAWHLHYRQEDVWYVPPEDHLILGLWDLRDTSPTKHMKMKVVLGNGHSRVVYIPRGVAHGVTNCSSATGTVWYLVNNQFTLENPDEQRLQWDAAGASFWEIEKG